MPEAGHYRDEARRCRAMARAATALATARRWHDLADEYEQLAVSLERGGRAPVVSAQRQPMQQQQSRAKDMT